MQKVSRRQKILASTLAVGNVIIIICIMLWFPAVGFDPFNFVHVRFVVAAEIISIIILAILIVGIVRRSGNWVIWVSEILQVLQLPLAIRAVPFWPGGDDGSKIGWQLFVTPIMFLIALYGLFCCVLSFQGRRPADLSAKRR